MCRRNSPAARPSPAAVTHGRWDRASSSSETPSTAAGGRQFCMAGTRTIFLWTKQIHTCPHVFRADFERVCVELAARLAGLGILAAANVRWLSLCATTCQHVWTQPLHSDRLVGDRD